MVKKQQLKSESAEEDSYISDDKYQPDDRYESSDDDSEDDGRDRVYSQQQEEGQEGDLSQDVEQKLSLLQKQEDKIKQQLKSLPYGLILKQRKALQQQKNQITQKIAKKKQIHKPNDKKNQLNQQKRDKHAPKQISIHKKPPKKTPLIFQSSRAKSIDPRFQDHAGFYNEDLAKKTMDFIPKLQEEEIKELRKALDQSKGNKQKNSRNKKKLTEGERKVLIEQYNRLTNEKRQNELSQIEKEAKRNIRSQQFNRGDNNGYRNNYNERSSFNDNNGYRNNYNDDRSGFNGNNNHRNSYNDRSSFNGNNSDRNNYNDRNQSNEGQRKGHIPKGRLREEFEKVKQSKMSDEQRKQYMKNKEKNIYRNQQVDRNNMMYETSTRFKARQNSK